jgi:hypothetical protein
MDLTVPAHHHHRNHKRKGVTKMPRITTNAVAKAPPMFGVPSLEISTRIDNSDKAAALNAAHYRCASRLRELESTFEVKASEIRQSFIEESFRILDSSEDE